MSPTRARSIVVAALFLLLLAACSDAPAPPVPDEAPAAEEAPAADGAPAAATAAPRTAALASGVPGGTYHERYAKEIDDRVGGWVITARPTAGSTENLDLLSEGAVDLALAQADVFASRIDEEPEVFGPLRIVALLAEECVFVAYRKGSAIDAFDDLSRMVGDREATIGIGPADGGMAETWNHLSSVLPEQANAAVDYTEGEAALEKLAKGELDAVAWMTDPRNTDHALLRAVREHPDLGLLDVEDERLFDVLAGDTGVYLPRTLPLRDGNGESLETICTPALLLARPDAPEGLLDALTAAGFSRI